MSAIKKTTLTLNELTEDEACLLAIHSPLEIIRLTYLINEGMGLNLRREREDLDVVNKGNTSYYPLYHYYDLNASLDFYLVINRSKTALISPSETSSLFGAGTAQTTFLIPEYSAVDYFLKAEGTENGEGLKSVLNRIPQITAVYEINLKKLKSYRNLIFE